MSSSPPSLRQLLLNKGKEKAARPPNLPDLNLIGQETEEGAAASLEKGEGMMAVGERPPFSNNNKRKTLVLGGPHHDGGRGPKNPRTGDCAGEQDGNIPSFLRKPTMRYACESCDRTFVSPQELLDHQNSHELEINLPNGPNVMHIATGYPLTGTRQGLDLNSMNMEEEEEEEDNNNQLMMVGYGNNQHDDVSLPFNGIFHPSPNAAGLVNMPHGNHEPADNSIVPFHPQWWIGEGGEGAPFEPGPTLFNHSLENVYNYAAWYGNYADAMYPGPYAAIDHPEPEPEGAWFNPGYENGYNYDLGGADDYDAPMFEHPDAAELAWMNHGGIGADHGYYYGDEVDNAYDDFHGDIDDEAFAYHAYHENDLPHLQAQEGYGNDDYQNAQTNQQVELVEIDFGLVPRCAQQGNETGPVVEEEAIDLTLRL